MTISTTPSEKSYAGDGVSTQFAIPFPFETAADIKVVRTEDATGSITQLTTGWSVTGGNGSTGTLTLTSALASGYTLTIIDDPEIKQSIDYVSNDAFPAETHERGLDRNVRMIKRVHQQVLRCLRTQDGDPVNDDDMVLPNVVNRANRLLAFDPSGKPEPAAAVDVPIEALTRSLIGALLYPQTPAEIAAGVTPTDYYYPPGNVMRYGADPSGASDSSTAFARAIAVARGTMDVPGCGVAYAPPGQFLIVGTPAADGYTDGVLIPYASQNSITRNVVLRGASRSTVLLCGSDNMILVRHSASNCRVEQLTLAANGKAGCVGLGVVAEDTTQTSTRVDQNFNEFGYIWIEGAFDEGIWMKAGPDVGGGDSGCWYNVFRSVHVRGARRGLWLDNPNNAGGSAVNRNRFFACRFGEAGMNTGVQIDAGDTNEFHGCAFEGIQSGASPNATPTAIVIKGSAGSTESNRFFGCTMEACTRSVENENPRSEFYGCGIHAALWTAKPLVLIGGYDPSQTPSVVPGYSFQTNNQFPGEENASLNLWGGRITFPASPNPSAEQHTLDDYREGTWTPVLAGATTPGTQGYVSQSGTYTKIGRLVIASCSILLSAKDASMAGDVLISGLPFANGANTAHAFVSGFGGIDLPTGYTQLGAYIVGGNQHANLTVSGDSVALQHLGSSAITASSYLELTFVYQAAQ